MRDGGRALTAAQRDARTRNMTENEKTWGKKTDENIYAKLRWKREKDKIEAKHGEFQRKRQTRPI